MPRIIEVSAKIGAMIVRSAAASGADTTALCTATRFDPTTAADPDARIPIAAETALWDEAARMTGDSAFGLHTAERIGPGAFDVLDYAVRTAPTLRSALDRLARYNALVHDVAVFTIRDAGDVTRIEHSLLHGTQSPHAAEFTLASLVVIGRQMSGAPLAAREVDLRHLAPASTAEHERLFGVRPRFGTEVNALELDRAALARPLPAADPMLSDVIVRHAEALLAARPAPTTLIADRVRRMLAEALGEGAVSLATIATRLKMSERSLQRRLSDEGTTFDAVVEEMRRDLALRYLGDRNVAIAEVAYLLGYSEPSAFHRAFKRWTGATPAEMRRRAA